MTFIKRIIARSQSPLSRQIVFWLFVSIFFIEAILLIPSVKRREQELLGQIQEVSSGKVFWLITDIINEGRATNQEFVARFQELQKLNPDILGGAIYTVDGQLMGSFGESPQLPLTQQKNNKSKTFYNGTRYDVVWSSKKLPVNYTLILRHDTEGVRVELYYFILRIIGLVFIIAAFTTVTLWIALEPIVIFPILQLRNDLIKAGEAISQDQETPQFNSATIKRQDELGDVISAFKKMYGQITSAISKRKQAEAALQVSLNEVEAYSQALNHELETGWEIQKNFLPTQLVQKNGWEFASFFQPARQVSGDFYDTFEINNHVGLVIADVCDKGVGAALFMALFRSMLRVFSTPTQLRGQSSAILQANQPIDGGWIGDNMSTNLVHLNALQAVSLTNDYVAENHSELGMFATLFFGILDPENGLLTYINGGHEPLYIIHANGGIKQQLKVTGPAVGMLPGSNFKISQTYLQPGELLFGYTDGITEARATDGEFFSTERLKTLLQPPVSSANNLLERITIDVLAHTKEAEQFDDMTMLIVQRLNNLFFNVVPADN
ncbi:MAG: PP2C family protein-serine/threonine phosphatase [Symploca sp. SIO2B6]|nr:PP2C family protein-serine/threonine phosphatase [Symploca sp. SIO2B6]